MIWPSWLAPFLLLLELMAQPTSLPAEEDAENEGNTAKMGKKGDFAKVIVEHKKQKAALAKQTKHIFTVLNKDSSVTSKKKKDPTKHHKTDKDEQPMSTKDDSSSKKDGVKEAPQTLSLPDLPILLPLIRFEDAEASMRLCLQLLGLRSSRKSLDPQHLERACPPPSKFSTIFSLS